MFLPAVLIPYCDSSSLAVCMMYSVYKLDKQGDSTQPWCTPLPILTGPLLHVRFCLLLLDLHTRFSGIRGFRLFNVYFSCSIYHCLVLYYTCIFCLWSVSSNMLLISTWQGSYLFCSLWWSSSPKITLYTVRRGEMVSSATAGCTAYTSTKVQRKSSQISSKISGLGKKWKR